MKRFLIGTISPLVVFAALGINALAQSPSPPPSGEYPAHTFPESLDDRQSEQNLPPREDRVLKQGLLAPATSDRQAYAAFLRKSDTGLIRLLPREVYNSAIYHPKRQVKIRGGGAYYSFAYLTHVYGYGSDIELDRDKLSVGFAGADFGMMTNLGDTSLEEITLSNLRARYISKYSPPREERKAREEYRRFGFPDGVMVDGAAFRKSVPVQENTTFLLRSIVYDRSDVLVAFRVVRKDTDGSVIIAWKMLKKNPKPELARTNQ